MVWTSPVIHPIIGPMEEENHMPHRVLTVRATLAASCAALLLTLPGHASAETSSGHATANATVRLVQASTQADTTAPAELLFSTPHLSTVDAGRTLDYAVHTIRTDATSGAATESDGHIALAASMADDPDSRTIDAVLTRDGRSRTLEPFRGVRSNPVLIIFLEQITQDLSQQTGGSKYYLRNRLREGLADGLVPEPSGSGTRLVMRPLLDDPNAVELGPYINLEVSFTVDDSLPGMFGALTAKAGPEDAPVFLEEVRYDAES